MPAELSNNLPDYPVVISWPVQWGDQDLFGHVNNTVYFRWYESSRIAYLDRIGVSDMMNRERVGPILAAICCNYRRQLNFPDTVEIGSRVTRIGRSSATMTHAIWSQQQRALVADGESTIVMFDYQTQRPVPVPDSIRQAIEKLEGRTLE